MGGLLIAPLIVKPCASSLTSSYSLVVKEAGSTHSLTTSIFLLCHPKIAPKKQILNVFLVHFPLTSMESASLVRFLKVHPRCTMQDFSNHHFCPSGKVEPSESG